MMSDITLWQKAARVIMLLAERLEIEPREALNIFYASDTGRWLLTQQYDLHTMSDEYLVDEIIK